MKWNSQFIGDRIEFQFMLSKDEIRRGVRSIRDALAPPTPSAGAELESHLINLPALRDAKVWFIYVSFGSEVNTHELIHFLLARGDTVCVPRVVAPGEMVAQQILSFNELQQGDFGILAPPPPGEPYLQAIDVCICPGLAFSEQGDRLGTGGGYYDRYLAAHRPRIVVGLAFDFQVKPELPVEKYDGRMDYIITEKRVIHVGGSL